MSTNANAPVLLWDIAAKLTLLYEPQTSKTHMKPKGIWPSITLSIDLRTSALRAIILKHRSKAEFALRAI